MRNSASIEKKVIPGKFFSLEQKNILTQICLFVEGKFLLGASAAFIFHLLVEKEGVFLRLWFCFSGNEFQNSVLES